MLYSCCIHVVFMLYSCCIRVYAISNIFNSFLSNISKEGVLASEHVDGRSRATELPCLILGLLSIIFICVYIFK